MAEDRKKLFDQFAPVSPEEWRAKAEVDLKGADFNKKMVWRTNEGFNVQPLYRGVDIKNLKATESLPGEYPYVRGTRTDNNWQRRQDIDVKDVAAANAKAREILTKGITSLGFKLHKGSDVDIKALLEGIEAAEAGVGAALAAHDYPAAIDALAALRAPIDRFFEDVLVMDEDERVRAMRLALLNRFVSVFGSVADIGKLASK